MEATTKIDNLTPRINELLKQHMITAEQLTQTQLAAAIKQAIACGDFIRLIVADASQSVIYLPYANQQRLEAEIEELKQQLAEGTKLMKEFIEQHNI